MIWEFLCVHGSSNWKACKYHERERQAQYLNTFQWDCRTTETKNTLKINQSWCYMSVTSQ